MNFKNTRSTIYRSLRKSEILYSPPGLKYISKVIQVDSKSKIVIGHPTPNLLWVESINHGRRKIISTSEIRFNCLRAINFLPAHNNLGLFWPQEVWGWLEQSVKITSSQNLRTSLLRAKRTGMITSLAV